MFAYTLTVDVVRVTNIDVSSLFEWYKVPMVDIIY